MTAGTWAGRLRGRGAWLGGAAALLIFVVVGLLVILLPSTLTVAVLAGGAAVLLWLVVPEPVILALLLLRSSVDGFMEVFTLFAGSPLSMNLSGAINSLAVGLGVLTLVRRLLRRQPLLVAGPGWTYSLFLLVGLVGIPASVDLTASIKEWAHVASGLAIYLMVADVVHDERGARRVLVAVMVSSLVPLALGLFQKLTGGGYFFLGFVGTEFAYRPQGTFAHPGGFAAYLVLLLTMAAGLYFSIPSARLRATLLLWGAVAVTCLLLTLARSEWAGMMAAALVLGLLKRRRLALLALAGTAVLLVAVPFFWERLTSTQTLVWRLNLWAASAKLAWPPTIVGKGLGTSPWYINQLLPKVDAPPHDDYLNVLIETGLLGLLAYGAWLLALVRHAWRAYKQAISPVIAWRALALLATTIAGMVMSISDNYLGHTAVQWYFWTLAALVPAGGRWPAAAEKETNHPL